MKCLSFICKPLLDAGEVAHLLEFVLDTANGANFSIPDDEGFYGLQWFMHRYGDPRENRYCLTSEKMERYARLLVRDNIQFCLREPFTTTALSKRVDQFEASLEDAGTFFYMDRDTKEKVFPVVAVEGPFMCVRFRREDDRLVEKVGDADHAKIKGVEYVGALRELMSAAEILGFQPVTFLEGLPNQEGQELRIQLTVDPEYQALFLQHFPQALITCPVVLHQAEGSGGRMEPVNEGDAKAALNQFRLFAETLAAQIQAARVAAEKTAAEAAAQAAADYRLFAQSMKEILPGGSGAAPKGPF